MLIESITIIHYALNQGGYNMAIKAIMCDIDGTLLSSKGYVTDKTVEMIKKAREKGILFGLSTGRDVNSIQTLLKDWHIDGLVDLIVGTGGAEIYDYTLNISKAQYPLDGESIKEIIEHFKDMDCNFTICHEGILYAPKDDDYIRDMAEGDGIEYRVVDFDTFLIRPYRKLMIICNPSYMPQIVERSKSFKNKEYKASALVTTSFLYEYMNPHVSKSNGLKEALALHDISISQCMAFGDEDNDIDMLEEAGIGVVMENGSIHAKDAADYVTKDKDSNGIGVFIDKFI